MNGSWCSKLGRKFQSWVMAFGRWIHSFLCHMFVGLGEQTNMTTFSWYHFSVNDRLGMWFSYPHIFPVQSGTVTLLRGKTDNQWLLSVQSFGHGLSYKRNVWVLLGVTQNKLLSYSPVHGNPPAPFRVTQGIRRVPGEGTGLHGRAGDPACLSCVEQLTAEQR